MWKIARAVGILASLTIGANSHAVSAVSSKQSNQNPTNNSSGDHNQGEKLDLSSLYNSIVLVHLEDLTSASPNWTTEN